MRKLFGFVFLVAALFASFSSTEMVLAHEKSLPWWQYPVTWSHAQGDMGEDIGTPVWTPITALCSGPIVGAGYYGGGGVVTTRCAGVGDVYYQHMDSIASWIKECAPYGNNGLPPCGGEWVTYGNLLGYSGGDCGWHFFGNPCALGWSNGEHTEIGINPPWYGIWGPVPHPGGVQDPYWFVRGGGIAGIGRPNGSGSGGSVNATDTEHDRDTDDLPFLYTVKATGPCPCTSLELIAHWYGFSDDAHLAAWQKVYNLRTNAHIIKRDATAHGIKRHFEAYLYTGEKIWV